MLPSARPRKLKSRSGRKRTFRICGLSWKSKGSRLMRMACDSLGSIDMSSLERLRAVDSSNEAMLIL